MENITLNFLGTGSAIPTKRRNHVGILVSFANENILVDCGEGIQRQFRIAELSPSKLTKILITHHHGDHILGLPGLFQTLAMQDYSKTLKIYGPKNITHYIRLIEELIRGFNISLKVEEVSGKFLNEKNYFIESAEMHHGVPANAYSIVLKDRVRLNKSKLKKLKVPNSPIIKELQQGKDIVVNGKKIRAKDVCYIEKGKKITIVLDTSYNENAVKLAKNSDLLICESDFMEKDYEKAKEYLHLTAKQAAQIAKKSNSKRLVLIHLSQRYDANPKEVEKEAKKVFKNTKIARDFDKIVI